MPKIKLIATDIDGTILKHNFEFNPEVKDCIKDLAQHGVKVVLVTGRMHAATQHIAEELALETPLVCYQGGLVKHNNEILYERNLDTESAKNIINWAKKNNIHTNLYMNDELYVEKDSPTIQRYLKQGIPRFNIKSFDEIKLEKINKMLLIDYEDENKVTVWKEYLETKYKEVHFIKSTPYYCEVCHPEATKACALNFLKDYWGFKKEEIMTIGDQNNDIDLLSAGGIKVAMGNATEELKAVADYVTDTVNDNGFVKAVEKFVYEDAAKYSRRE